MAANPTRYEADAACDARARRHVAAVTVASGLAARNNEERRRAEAGEDVGASSVLALWICNLSVPAERWDESAARDARQLVRAFRVNT